jgi:hypothetical protein
MVEDLTRRQVKLSLGGAVHDPDRSEGALLFNVLAMVAEFEGDLIRLRTREGMRQKAHLVALHRSGEHSVAELGDLFGVTRSTVYGAIQRDAARQRTALHGGSAPGGTIS